MTIDFLLQVLKLFWKNLDPVMIHLFVEKWTWKGDTFLCLDGKIAVRD
jgi:hypothetical protein